MKKFGLIIALLLLLVFSGVAVSSSLNELSMPLMFKGGSYVDTPTPTVTLTPTLRPTNTPEPTRETTPVPTFPPDLSLDPDYPWNWIWVGGAIERDGVTKIANTKVSFCHELFARKIDKTIYVWSEYIGDTNCKEKVDLINTECRLPGCRQAEFPLPVCTGDDNVDFNLFPCACPDYNTSKDNLFCGEVDLIEYYANSQEVCNYLYPSNCVIPE